MKFDEAHFIENTGLISYLFSKFVASFLPIAIPKSAKADMSSSRSTFPEIN